MDNREAKFILNAYRPSGLDADDPCFDDALEQARRDPVLERWFSESIAFDAAMTEKLRDIPAPPDLRENILAGVKVSRRVRSTFIKWAIAAALFVTAVVGSVIWQNTRPVHLAEWQRQALDVISALVRQDSSLDLQSRNPDELLAWLRANHAPAALKLPDNLGKLSSLGCKAFSPNGTPVSVICFMRPDGGLIHLVATAATPATNRVANVKPTLLRQGKWTTATWREGDMIYMLALEGSPDQLRPYLS
jgi:hypothetical protein